MVSKLRKSREVKIGKVSIGGRNPVVVQAMAKTFTSDLSATVEEIRRLQIAGAKIVRLAVKDNKDAANLRKIKQKTNIPLVADIHFDKNLALQAIASGIDKIRLNPGNIYKKSDVKEVAEAAKQASIPIRVGVNSGSIRGLKSQVAGCRSQASGHRGRSIELTTSQRRFAREMVKSTLDYIKVLEGCGFYDIVVSLKSSDIFTTIAANQEIARHCDYPIHLGITASGLALAGIVKSAMVIGGLLFDGIGDTIRVSLTDTAVQEVRVAYKILEALGVENSGPEIISCPTCGRCEVDLVNIVKELEKKLCAINPSFLTRPVKLAVMGCVVNGPGEAKTADLGIAFGKKDGLLFRKGKPVVKLAASNCVEELLAELRKLK